jgi:hypothetical protein
MVTRKLREQSEWRRRCRRSCQSEAIRLEKFTAAAVPVQKKAHTCRIYISNAQK